MNQIRSITSAIKTLNGLQNFEHSVPSSIGEKDDHYPGLSNEDTPLKIFHPKNPTGAILILYPGASAKGEAHPKMIALARSIAVNGIQVYIPRIPPLINLKLSKNILKNCINEIEYFCLAAALIAASVAADPTIGAVPPSAAPIARDHHN